MFVNRRFGQGRIYNPKIGDTSGTWINVCQVRGGSFFAPVEGRFPDQTPIELRHHINPSEWMSRVYSPLQESLAKYVSVRWYKYVIDVLGFCVLFALLNTFTAFFPELVGRFKIPVILILFPLGALMYMSVQDGAAGREVNEKLEEMNRYFHHKGLTWHLIRTTSGLYGVFHQSIECRIAIQATGQPVQQATHAQVSQAATGIPTYVVGRS